MGDETVGEVSCQFNYIYIEEDFVHVGSCIGDVLRISSSLS